VAFGAVSALGEGEAATHVGNPGEPARVAIARDEELARAGLERPFVARASTGDARELLTRALAECAEELDRVRPGWRGTRVGLVLGTSSGGMRSAERGFAVLARGERPEDPEAMTYFGPMAQAVRSVGMMFAPSMLVLGACASGALSVGLGMRWLARGDCDLVLAGGFDDVTIFVAAGFEALRATATSIPPRPFRVGRDGMALGEGAAVLAMAPADAPPVLTTPGQSLGRVRARDRIHAYVTGFGASADAVHITAPDRNGAGLARAARAALREAGDPSVDLVSPHATATPFNDAAEWRAIVTALGDEDARRVVLHPLKAQVGHTLGAAGALELLACTDAIARSVLPASAGDGTLDPDAPARLLDVAATAPVRTALKLSAAFGGANAALVASAHPGPGGRAIRPAFVHSAVHVPGEPSLEELSAAIDLPVDRLGRTDAFVRLALSAVHRLERSAGSLRGAGIVIGTALGPVETNALFATRIRERGARAAEPRRFPYTSPNAAPGECAIAFGLTGPAFAVGGGLHAGLEALAAAALLVEAGDAERVVVVAADDVGPATRALAGGALSSGAVAALVSADARGSRARVGAMRIARGRNAGAEGPFGHEALLALLASPLPRVLACASPPDAFAQVSLEPV
jgi:3-oxoacyl-[acyl-carrier-protein] synthase-1/3-oxoacyl-[acyl-carrier-protein] synthase II